MCRTSFLLTWLLHEHPAVLAEEPGECISRLKYPRRSLVRLRGLRMTGRGGTASQSHLLSYTALLVTIFPFAPVRMIVTVRDFPSGSITIRPVAFL